jgi:YD repeat-containing protein
LKEHVEDVDSGPPSRIHARTSLRWNTTRRVICVGNPLSQRTTLNYFASTGDLESIQNALNKRTTYSYETTGKVKSINDPLNNTMTIVRDGMNRVTAITNPRAKITTDAALCACARAANCALEPLPRRVHCYPYRQEIIWYFC